MSIQVPVDTDEARYAQHRETLLTEAGGVPGWMAVHGVVGREGSPDSGCTCRRGWQCDRKGKHPVASRFPHGSRDACTLAEAVGFLESGTADAAGARLAAVIAPEIAERVLDADSDRGLATLWRCGEELEAGWLHVRTPRGLHVWQTDVVPSEHGGDERVNRWTQPVGMDVKANGFVIWPDGRARWPMAWDAAQRWLASRFPGTDAGDGVIAGHRPRQRSRSQPLGEQHALVACAGRWSTPEELHADALGLVRTASHGGRNDALNLAAFFCRSLVAARWPVGEVADSLYAVGRDVGLDHGETERTVRSGLGIERGQWWSRRHGG